MPASPAYASAATPPGQLILEVAGQNGPLGLASDAIHHYDELETERPFAVFSDLGEMYRGYARLREYAAAGAAVVPGTTRS